MFLALYCEAGHIYFCYLFILHRITSLPSSGLFTCIRLLFSASRCLNNSLFAKNTINYRFVIHFSLF